MWSIQNVIVEAPDIEVTLSDGLPISARRGPAGSSVRMAVGRLGFLDITDTGHQTGGPHYWQLHFNGEIYWYDGEGAPSIIIRSDGHFLVTGDGNEVKGRLKPVPEVLPRDVDLIKEMEDHRLIPYQSVTGNQRPFSAVEPLANQYLGFSPLARTLALSIYDWTTADFFRLDIFHFYRYTALPGSPASDDDIINAISTTSWPPYTPADKFFMHSMMMGPVSEPYQAGVTAQYPNIKQSLIQYLDALGRVTTAAMQSMPRTSVLSKPELYSGQVDVSNLGPDALATYFLQYPGNNGPKGSPMGMPIDQALTGFMQPGSVINLKSVMSFTHSLEDAQRYSNGIIVRIKPSPGSEVWTQCAYITPLSNEVDKIEYTFPGGSAFKVNNYEKQIIDGREYVVIYLEEATNS